MHKYPKSQPIAGICLIIFHFSFFIFISCTPDPEPTLRFKDREIVDSIFKVKVDSLKPLVDSLCEVRHDSAVMFKVDSMMKVRQAEIDKYLQRIKNEQERGG